MLKNISIGTLTISKSGRDKGKYLLIIGIVDENYVYIVDGNLRRVEKPKLKKIKHLIFTNIVNEEMKNFIESGNKISNLQIREFIQRSVDITNKEV